MAGAIVPATPSSADNPIWRPRHPGGRPQRATTSRSAGLILLTRIDARVQPAIPMPYDFLMIVESFWSGYSATFVADIFTAVNEFASGSPSVGPHSAAALASLAGQRVAFTGTLASMTHRQAQQVVEEHGGAPTEHVSRATTLLVVGEEGWPLEADGRPSVKLLAAQRLRAEGAELRIVNESDWLGFVGLDDRRSQLEQVCTPAMLSQWLGVPVQQIRRWDRLGLIRAVRRVHRLPYFDLREVASAQRLAGLLASGVPVDKVRDSLYRLKQIVGDRWSALDQLELLSRGGELAFRDWSGRLKTVRGQRLIDFEPCLDQSPGDGSGDATMSAAAPDVQPPDRERWEHADWFEEGQRLALEGDLDAAREALRMSLMLNHDAPEVQFQLAEVLYRLGHDRAALERFYVAVELDREYLDAWTQIGCLHAGLGDNQAAIDAFLIALDLQHDAADIHYHKAEVHRQQGEADLARVHYERYLTLNQRGPWADLARERLTTPAEVPAAPS